MNQNRDFPDPERTAVKRISHKQMELQLGTSLIEETADIDFDVKNFLGPQTGELSSAEILA